MIKLLVKANDGMGFFQVLVLNALDAETAVTQAAEWLSAAGIRMCGVDEEETAEIAQAPPGWTAPENPFGVIAASGRIYYEREDEDLLQ